MIGGERRTAVASFWVTGSRYGVYPMGKRVRFETGSGNRGLAGLPGLWRIVVAFAALAAVFAVLSPGAISSASEPGCPASWGSRVDPPPSVTIDTNAKGPGGATGIQIKGPTPLIAQCFPGANAFYPGTEDKWLHILVLNRKTLSMVYDHSYDCPESTAHPTPSEVGQLSRCVEEVRTALGSYQNADHSNLVIATSQYDGKNPDVQPPVGMFAALNPSLGVDLWNWWNDHAKVTRGTFVAIGVAGAPDLGRELIGAQGDAGSARIIDNLVRDNQGNYGLVPGQRVEFDTQAPGSDEAKGINVIRVGDKQFRQQGCTNKGGGIQALILDAQTLDGNSYYFEIRDPSGLAGVLRKAHDAAAAPFSRPTLVFLASCGVPSYLGPVDIPNYADAADRVTAAGGTRTRYLDASLNGKAYALVGKAHSSTGSGVEVLGSPLTGVLARTGRYYDYQSETTGAFGPAASGDLYTGTTQLLQTIGSTHSDWPEVADAQGRPTPRAANKAAALAYISEQEFDGTPDPRTQYWSYPWGTGASTHWKNIESAIAKLSFPASQQQFDVQDFAWAQTELQNEIEWLIDEHTYMEQRAKPFYTSVLESWADLQNIAAQIDNEVKAPDKTVQAQVAVALNFAVEIGREVPLIGKAVGASAAIYKYISEWNSIGSEPIENAFPVKTGEVGKQFAERMSLAQELLTTDLPNVIASDYRTLKTVGECADTTAPDHTECPFKSKDWQYTPDDQKAAAEGLKDSSSVAVYAALLPAKYQAWELPASQNDTANRHFAGRATFGCFYPFAAEPDTGQIAVPQELFGDKRITALGFLSGAGVIYDRYEMHTPAASVTDRLFGTGKGQLGINREEFFARFFVPKAGLHYPERDTPTGWDLALCNSAPGLTG